MSFRFSLAAGEVGRHDRSTTVPGERPVGDADSDPAKAGAEHDGAVPRACKPLVHDPLGGDTRSPREVLAVDRAAGALGENPGGDRPVGEVLTVHHVRRMAAGGPKEADVQAEGGQPPARPDRVHRLEQ